MVSPRRAALVAVLGLAAAACNDDAGTIVLPLVLETFETACDGLPCEWAPLPGSEDAVRRVETLHPGVHGLRLEGDGAAAAGPARVEGLGSAGGFGRGPEVVFTPPPWEAPLGVQITGRCDEGSGVEVTLTASVGVEGSDATPTSVAYRGVVTPGPRFSPPARGLMLADAPTPPPGDDGVVLSGEAVTLRKQGPGRCDVALLVVGSPGG